MYIFPVPSKIARFINKHVPESICKVYKHCTVYVHFPSNWTRRSLGASISIARVDPQLTHLAVAQCIRYQVETGTSLLFRTVRRQVPPAIRHPIPIPSSHPSIHPSPPVHLVYTIQYVTARRLHPMGQTKRSRWSERSIVASRLYQKRGATLNYHKVYE